MERQPTQICRITDGPEKNVLLETLGEFQERDPKTVTFTVTNPKPGGHPDTDTCDLSIYSLYSKGDGKQFIFLGKHGSCIVDGEYNTETKQGKVNFY